MRERDSDKNRFEDMVIEKGLKAYRVPDMEEWDDSPDVIKSGYRLPTEKEAQEKINKILASIERQGGELKGVIAMKVATKDAIHYERHFLLVDKK